MFLHDRKRLISQVTHQPKRGGGDGHSAPANLGGVNLRDDDPAGDSIAKCMTGHEAHHTDQDCQPATVYVVEPADQRKTFPPRPRSYKLTWAHSPCVLSADVLRQPIIPRGYPYAF